MRYLIVQNNTSYMEYPLMEGGTADGLEYKQKGGKILIGEQPLKPGEWHELQGHRLLYLGEVFSVYERKEWTFLSGDNADICISGCAAKIMTKADSLLIENSGDTILYLNQESVGDGSYPLDPGAVLLIENCKFIFGEKYIKVWGDDYQSFLPRMSDSLGIGEIEQFPLYKRSPRLIKRISDKKVKIEAEPSTGNFGRKGLVQMVLPPLCMVLVTVLIGVLLKRGLFILMSASFTGMTAIFSVVKYFQDKKESKEKEAKKKEIYGNYLLEKRKEIYKCWQAENEAYRYNYPQADEICRMVGNYSSRIYERSNMDEDFLTFAVGHYMGPAVFAIEDRTSDISLESSEFADEIRSMKRQFGVIDKPQVVDLKKANLGLVGEKSVIHEQLKYYVSQLSFAQSYHDVQFIVLYSEDYKDDFSWMRWLSHARIQGLNVLGLIYTEKIRDQVLGSLQQILKERRQRVEESKKEARFLPHLIFIIDEPKIIIDHSIMEFFAGDTWQTLGFSIIYTSLQQANLPENIGTVLLLENSGEGRLLLQEKELCDRRIHLYRIGDTNLEMMARNLGVLVHEQGMNSHIPESITFFEMYGVQNPEELKVRERWRRNNSSKTLTVPLGARAAGDYLELNLHEKAHGPHGLIAGTTGSGKSEIVQSYILSLAVNFHPYEVGFLLIDYKGGGMANLFKNLPHLLGTITNLDGGESMRALASIQSELRRRQKIFSEHEVNHINAYNDLFKTGRAKEPIPHLFIISDEFAELKKEQPEFMKELVSAARIGRSLGVHLILATQKPTGVVDDQIWTNSKFRICLKVQNESDSKEVLHTPDAANITQAGRAYLQVGNNEIYELFQSAWSGALYIRESEKEVTQDNRIYLVNELGQGELINQDLRGTEAEQKATETQLDAVVRYVHQLYEREKVLEVKKPWLAPLADRIVNPHMKIRKNPILDLDVVLGILDVPEEQIQEEYTVNLAKEGNIVYIASSGYGKSVFLENIILGLAAKNCVANLNFYTLDFGNNSLITLAKLPHMADYIMLDEEEKFTKFRALMTEEIKQRKKQLAAALAQNFVVYNEMAETPLKAIVICLDNYDAVKEMGYEMENYFTKLSRDGMGLGIYIAATASRMSALRAATLNNFKNKIAGVNFDENEVKGLVGRSKYSLPDVQGRTLVKTGENVNAMQLYTPVELKNEVDYSRNLQAFAEQMSQEYKGEEAPHIPILPEELSYQEFLSYGQDENEIAMGLERESVVSTGWARQNSPILILGESGSGKTNALKVILNQLDETATLYLFDSRSRSLYDYREKGKYMTTLEELELFANQLNVEISQRKNQMDTMLLEGKPLQEVLKSIEPYYVVIDDIDDFIDLAGKDMPIVAGRLKRAMQCGITFIVAADINKFKGQDEFTQALKSARNGLLLSSQGYLAIFPIRVNEAPRKPDGVLMAEGQVKFIRIPQVVQR
ncbi:type VII secretion protein EssC [Muricomes intestini]|uniref:type VII secretion protein EssC n=1 Tax=Muricomes intestini TaxID=1796634 RepID=UPI002FE2ACCC